MRTGVSDIRGVARGFERLPQQIVEQLFGGRGQTDPYRTVPRVIPEVPGGPHRDIAHALTRLGSGHRLQQQRRDLHIQVREGGIDGAEWFESTRLHRKTPPPPSRVRLPPLLEPHL